MSRTTQIHRPQSNPTLIQSPFEGTEKFLER
jgi:hypothetical protein